MAIGDAKTYGTSWFCLSRRIYVTLVCAFFTTLYMAQIVKWALFSRVAQEFMGETLPPAGTGCVGLQCYQVFTCRGFSWVTAHIQQPMFTLVGCIIFPLGFNACLYGFRFELRLVAVWLLLLTMIYIVCFIADIAYFGVCNAYPGNEIHKVFNWHLSLFLTPAQQDSLSHMDFYPKDQTDQVTGNFPTQPVYLWGNAVFIAIMLYTAREARQLGLIFERGTLGLGIHYGFGAFTDIVRNSELQQRKAPTSRFTSDANPPLWKADVRTPLPFRISKEYGTNYKQKDGGKPDEFTSHVGDDLTTVEKLKILAGRHSHLEEKFTSVHLELQESEEALHKAIQARHRQKEKEYQLETEAMVKFRAKEIKKETHWEHIAEEVAEEKAEEKAQEAEADGGDDREVGRAAAEAFRKQIAKEHNMMLNLAKCRTIHEHYRHAEREQHYREMAEDVDREVKECEERVRLAKEEVHKVEEYAGALGRREELLLDQDIQERMEDEERLRKLANKHADKHASVAKQPAQQDFVGSQEAFEEMEAEAEAEALEGGEIPQGQEYYINYDPVTLPSPNPSMGPAWGAAHPVLPGTYSSLPVGTMQTNFPQMTTASMGPMQTATSLPPQNVAMTLPPTNVSSMPVGTLPPWGSAPTSMVTIGQSGNFGPTPVPSNLPQ